jgi:hypothetical protein
MYFWTRENLGEIGLFPRAGRQTLAPLTSGALVQHRGNCSGWESDPESFSKVVADHYVMTQYPSLIGRAEKIWCDARKIMCIVYYSTGIRVAVSFARTPDFVIARRYEHPTGPRCEYDYDCADSGRLILRKRDCRPS